MFLNHFLRALSQPGHRPRNTMSISHLVLQILLALSASTAFGRPTRTPLRHRLLSAVTGRYLSVTKSGRVHANGIINLNNPAKDATPIFLDRLYQQNHVRVASVKYASNSWYLVVTEEGKIRAQVPEDGNEILEEIYLPDGYMTLRFANYERIVSSQEGSGAPSGTSDDSGLLMPHTETGEEAAERRECYLGFAPRTGRARCYSDASSVDVRLHIIPHE